MADYKWPLGYVACAKCKRPVSLETKICSACGEEQGGESGEGSLYQLAINDAIEWIRSNWLAAYPVEIFPEPPPPPAECSRDLISAAMGRHMCQQLIKELEAMRLDDPSAVSGDHNVSTESSSQPEYQRIRAAVKKLADNHPPISAVGEMLRKVMEIIDGNQ